MHKLVVGHMNINSMRNKFDPLTPAVAEIHPFLFFKILSVEFHKVLCWVVCYLTFFSQPFFFFVLLKLQAMLMPTHHRQREIVLKNFAKSRRSLRHSV